MQKTWIAILNKQTDKNLLPFMQKTWSKKIFVAKFLSMHLLQLRLAVQKSVMV